jgi:hypothetical protein
MIWRFTILNNRTAVATVVDEPTGWDANTSEIKRDLDWHGIFFTNQGETFQFTGKAMKLLKEEYEQYGVQADMALIMEEDCGKGFEEFSRGSFMFKNYEYICGDECFVKCSIETSSEIKDLRNRINQKVNLQALKSFDETTTLPAYDKLPFELELPSKGIFIKDENNTEGTNAEVFDGNTLPPFNTGINNVGYHALELGFNKQVSSEIGDFYNSTTHLLTKIQYSGGDPAIVDGTTFSHTVTGVSFPVALYPLYCSPFLSYDEGMINYGDISNPVDLDIKLNGRLEIIESYVGEVVIHLLHLPYRKNINNGENEADYNYLWEYPLFSKTSNSFPSDYYNGNIDIAIQHTRQLTLAKGDRYYLFISISEVKSAANITAVNGGAKAFKFYLNDQNFGGSYIKITNLSKTNASVSKVFAINETISRIAESITNDKLRAYSEYFGRIDSQPYSHSADGCGSLEVLTNGLRLRRQEDKVVGKTNLFTLSLQDIWEGLNPIHNIGMGLEPDTNRTGYNRLRIESWNYFYNNSVVLSCADINKISRKVYEKDIFSTFQFGYQKWEAEEYTGLDEFLTKRTYRTTLNQVKNDFVKLSKFVYSGYALEITRRKDSDSKDWRYDKDTFGICVKRGKFRITINSVNPQIISIFPKPLAFVTVGDTITISNGGSANGTYSVSNAYNSSPELLLWIYPLISPGGDYTVDVDLAVNGVSEIPPLIVELGNVSSPQNIIDPDTLYNYRRSPLRNAMRWMNKVLASYRIFDTNAKLIFTDGDANYFAEGEMTSTRCKLENVDIAENDTIDLSIYNDTSKAQPFTIAERVVFDYPMTSKDYKIVESNPYGLIHFQGDCEEGYGWIDTIQYKPEQGIATFNLIPKVI